MRWSHWLSVRVACTRSVESTPNALSTYGCNLDILTPYTGHVHIITADNDSEFVERKAIEKAQRGDFYFAYPYSFCERKLNENFHELLRQFIPKGTDLKLITDEDVRRAETSLNLRSCKCFGLRQPEVVFQEYLQAA